MAKKRFAITPKLKDKTATKKLPVQDISVEAIETIAVGQSTKKEVTTTSSPTKKTKKVKQAPKRPQGRPRREEPVKRLSSDLPADLYDKVKKEVKDQGYTLNGFLAKVLRAYFENK